MDFVVRLPLIDFDIYNEVEIAANFPLIRNAIKESSPSLYAAVSKARYDELDDKIKIKIYKYLKRGKYRAVPFKNWAGLSVGRWGEANLVNIQSIKEEQCNSKNEIWERSFYEMDVFKEEYKINPFLSREGEWIVFLSFSSDEDQINGKWDWFKIKREPLIDNILSVLEGLSTVREVEFVEQKIFQNAQDALDWWGDLIRLGILVPEIQDMAELEKPNQINKSSIDFVVGEFVLNDSIRSILDSIPMEMGSLFKVKRSKILDRLKNSIRRQFDDRFVSLERLIDPSFCLWEVFEIDNSNHSAMKSEDIVFRGMIDLCSKDSGKIDLSAQKFGTIDQMDFEEIDYLFRIATTGEIVMDNLLVDQIGKLSGRFSFIKEIHDLHKCNTDMEIIRAEVILCESQGAHQIYTGKPIFDKCIYIDGLGRKTKNTLQLQDLYIGVVDEEIVLIDNISRKVVEPKFCTPMSYTKLSHPLAKLLWHISEHGKHRLNLYQEAKFLKIPYTPRITWGDIILMPSKWYFKNVGISDIVSAKEFIRTNGIPEKFLIGESDAELLVNCWQDKDLLLFLDEVKKLKEFFIYEYIDTGVYSENGKKVFPQYHYNAVSEYSGKQTKSVFINTVTSNNPDWVSLHFSVNELKLNEVLGEIFGFMNKVNVGFKWYFLIYDSEMTQIRVRIKVEKDTAKELKIKELLASVVMMEAVKGVERVPYYPEFDKYGKRGIGISESIFYKESEFIKGIIRNKTLDTLERVMIVGKVWSMCIPTKQTESFISYYYERYVQLNKETKHALQTTFQVLRKKVFTLKGLEDHIGIVNRLSESHPLDSCNGGVMVFMNHIHMFSNRMQVTGEYEELILYYVYRMLLYNKSKSCVRKDIPIGTSIPDSKVTLA